VDSWESSGSDWSVVRSSTAAQSVAGAAPASAHSVAGGGVVGVLGRGDVVVVVLEEEFMIVCMCVCVLRVFMRKIEMYRISILE